MRCPDLSVSVSMSPCACQRDVDHLPFDARDAAAQRPAAQEIGVQPGVEVIGVAVERREHRAGARKIEGVAPAGAHRHGKFLERRRIEPLLARAQPEMLELHAAPELAERAEGMYVAVTGPIPAAELDAELERALRLAHEARLVEPAAAR